ncbi:MAG: GIY-YIG nuclease family protein [Bacteroidales bacterium]|nr:GIY-YIG nuclease family protein [Bacteroidales bacterium]
MYKQYWTYILSNKTNSTLYIGVTDNLERRLQEHRSGSIPGFTQKYNCHKLVYYEEYSDINQAIDREKQLKKWSREKKEWLIDQMNKDRNDLMPEISPLASLGRNDNQ